MRLALRRQPTQIKWSDEAQFESHWRLERPIVDTCALPGPGVPSHGSSRSEVTATGACKVIACISDDARRASAKAFVAREREGLSR